MKRTNIRKTMIAVLAAAMCATGAVIPSTANTASVCHHSYECVSHGSSSSRSGDSQCCYYIDYFQCVFACKWCDHTMMSNHTEGRPHTLDLLYYEAHHVYMQCSYCSYIEYNS